MVVLLLTSAVFTAAQNITINRGVGFAPSCTPDNAVEGIYSADHDIIIDGINDCTLGQDSMLRVNGTMIVNAALVGGLFQNNRDLCADNLQYPTVTFNGRPDFLINLPDLLRRRNLLYQEVAP
jgi:hypothetical protein